MSARDLVKRTHLEGTCRIWDGPLDKGGYAVSSSRRVHIVVWEAVNGKVPDGLELDHLCNRRACVNAAHLDAVTHAENCRRAAERRTACRAGHQLTPDNVKFNRNGGKDSRICVECYRIRYERRHGRRPPEVRNVARRVGAA